MQSMAIGDGDAAAAPSSSGFPVSSLVISFLICSPSNCCLTQWVNILWIHELTIKYLPHIQIDQFSETFSCEHQQQQQQPR